MSVTKQDRPAWQSARDLPDLCELTAQWIEGRIGSQPGYYGPSDIEDPALVPLLARLCRAGFMTTQSQTGHAGPGYDGAWWEQRAAVEGFAGGYVTADIIMAAHDIGLSVIVHPLWDLPRWRYRRKRSVVVTRRRGRDYTEFGVQVPRRHIRDPHVGYGICHPDAVRALCEAAQVTVIDPEWGRESLLWDTLASILGRRPA